LINNINIIEDKDLYKIPFTIKQFLESQVFDIREFEVERNIDKKNVSFLMNLDNGRIAAINDSSIFIFNDSYLLCYEINLNEIQKKEVVIKSLYQMKNGNLICATEEGDIFIFKIYKKRYEILKTYSVKDEIYKIGEINENNICLLSKNSIQILDNNLNVVVKYNNKKTFSNFCLFSKNQLALITQGYIIFAKFEFDKINNQIDFFNENRLKKIISLNSFVRTEQYLIVGGIGEIYFYNICNNKCEYKKNEPKILNLKNDNEEVTFIYKIHDQLLLASTNKGYIYQITIDDKNVINIIGKLICQREISSILMLNYETILISKDDQIDILSVPIPNNKNCEIF
jgi:hypothetical protein